MLDTVRVDFTHSRGCANKYRLRVVAGDSLIKGDVRAADKGFPESGGFPRLPEGSAASQTPYDDAEF